MSNASELDQKGFREEAAGLSWPHADPPGHVFGVPRNCSQKARPRRALGWKQPWVLRGEIPQTELHALAALQTVGPAVAMPAESARPAAARRPLLGILTSWRGGNDSGPGSHPPSLRYNLPGHISPGIITPKVPFRALEPLPVWRSPHRRLQRGPEPAGSGTGGRVAVGAHNSPDS